MDSSGPERLRLPIVTVAEAARIRGERRKSRDGTYGSVFGRPAHGRASDASVLVDADARRDDDDPTRKWEVDFEMLRRVSGGRQRVFGARGLLG
jgi:hypothetical protein